MDRKLGGLILLFLAAWASAQESGWKHEVKRDAMTDETSCIVSAGDPNIVAPMIFYGHGHAIVMAAGGNFPGRDHTFRIDSHKALSGDGGLSVSASQTAITQMRTGKELKVRAYKWPNDWPVDVSIPLAGISEHLDACRSAVR